MTGAGFALRSPIAYRPPGGAATTRPEPPMTARGDAALIILDDDMAHVRVVGLTWPEFQITRAMQSGADHIVVLADPVFAAVLQAIDRARAAGVRVDLVSAAHTVGEVFDPYEPVLVLSGGVAPDAATAAWLADAPRPAILVTSCAQVGYERIDATDGWLGIARVDGALLRATAAVVGDWDFASTLLRQAVQAGATRKHIDSIADAREPAGAGAISRALIAASGDLPEGWGGYWVIAPLGHGAVIVLQRWLPAIVPVAGSVAVALFVLAPVLAVLATPTAAALALLAALLASDVAGRAWRITAPRARWARRLPLLARLAGAATLAALTARAAQTDHVPILLALILTGLMLLAARLPHTLLSVRWRPDVSGVAVLLAVGSIFGPVGLVSALAAATVHAFAALGRAQNKLSEALTPPH